MNLYQLTVPHFDKALQNVERMIDKAIEFAKEKKFEPNDLLTARLAPDQYALCRQIQIACDGAKLACARVSGKEAPVHEDVEKTWDELRARIRNVREFINAMKPADFEGAETRHIALPFMTGKTMLGFDYITSFALMNFGFHYTLVYAILRHNGVPLGKMDFIGALPLHDA
jgi:uncharacterized protein